MIWENGKMLGLLVAITLLAACGEPMFENAGSPNSLLGDREACAMELGKSPAAIAYRQNPMAHPDYVSQVSTDMNQCFERKGWKQVRSHQEQERLREATTSELAHSSEPMVLSDTQAREAFTAFTRAVEDELERTSSAAR